MEFDKNYNPLLIEDKWYANWLENRFFSSEPDHREAYTIVIPPPNVTGVLHMGHMLNNTIQDVLIRRARMLGKNACWLPGTDHASIATESKVVAMLKEKGIEKSQLNRDEFLKYAWEWKEKHGGIILEQLKKLGCSCDWDRTSFTMDDTLSESVIQVFVDLYNKGLIYRGIRMVNWDPQARTAVSDEEVIYKEVNSKLYYVKYFIEGSNDFITVATTRPETILGDTAVCVHPDDERYKHLSGKFVRVPMVNRIVPVIFDSYVDREFGTGALKITPAHDINDYEIGLKYKLPVIDIFNEDGTLSKEAQLFIGTDRFEARKLSEKLLIDEAYLLKTEDYNNKLGLSERTNAVIEPRISIQWFLKMEQLAKPALDNVLNDEIRFFPAKFKNVYKHWMENVKDWCISRQLWWGHRIPAWYSPDNEVEVAFSIEKAYQQFLAKNPDFKYKISDLRQDDDVLDTWFSSWLWPISTFDGIRNPENKDIRYYYPTNDLVTAPDIIFFWVARMIMAGYEFLHEKPFKNVYFTGTVRDKQRRKMSKSLGNSPEPIDLIKQYGADGVRIGMLLSSPAGNDLLFDESLCEQGRNFNNKIWNAFRLISSWNSETRQAQTDNDKLAVEWFTSKLSEAINQIDNHFEKYRISDALMTLYKLVWDDFCSRYLELIKPAQSKSINSITYQQTADFFENLLRLLHPFIPFITEELWHQLSNSEINKTINLTEWPEAKVVDAKIIVQMEEAFELISTVRDFRNANSLTQKEEFELIMTDKEMFEAIPAEIVIKMARLKSINMQLSVPENYPSFFYKKNEIFAAIEIQVSDEEISELKKEIAYYQGFLKSVNSKLSNENFVRNAPPQVVELERKKQNDTMEKIRSLEEKLNKITQ